MTMPIAASFGALGVAIGQGERHIYSSFKLVGFSAPWMDTSVRIRRGDGCGATTVGTAQG